MSNLSQRVKKAKATQFKHNPYEPNRYSTWGSKDKDYGEKYYTIELAKNTELLRTPDGPVTVCVISADCQKNTGAQICNCPGNERHTVCYHSLGAIYESFKNTGKLISFFETYHSACQMSFGGKILKIRSAAGSGNVWAVVKDWPKSKILSALENINLMRDTEEGID